MLPHQRTIALFMLLFSPFIQAENGQEILFSVYVGQDKVGTLLVNKKAEGHRTVYQLYSMVSVKLLVGIEIEENIRDVFANGFLQTSEHKRLVNNTQRVKNTLRYVNQKYELSRNEKMHSTLTTPIRSSIASLYFSEPILPVDVYSQNFLQIIPLQKKDKHRYELKLPNGASAEYQYENGALVRVLSHNAWGELRFERDK